MIRLLCIAPLVLSLLPALCLAAVAGEDNEDLIAQGVLGYVLEISPTHSLVQVGDRSFRVEQVVVVDSDDGVEKTGSLNDLHPGDLVAIGETDTDREGSIWIARKMVVYRGAAQAEIAAQLKAVLPLAEPGSDAPSLQNSPSSGSSPDRTDSVRRGRDRIIFENGVWHN
ncbi:hypothetical protein [Desulfolithobacter sp.]